MKKLSFLLIQFITLSQVIFISACSKDNDNYEQNQDVQSPATIEFLCSSVFWQYLPDEGVKVGEIYETFSFVRIGGKTTCTITTEEKQKIGESKEIETKKYSFVFNPPIVTLMDEGGNVKRTLTVYKLTRENSFGEKWLLIDGKKYLGWLKGVDI